MKTKIACLTSIIVFVASAATTAQKDITQNEKNYKWGFEADIIQPFIPTVEIFNIQLTRSIFTSSTSQHGDIVIGAYLRPNVEHDVVKEIDEYMLLLAYRHYFWKGLHVEAGMNTGYYWGWENLIDGKDYDGLSMFWEANMGYKFNLGQSSRFYICPQFGALGNVVADIGPRGGKPDNFLQGNLLLGINF